MAGIWYVRKNARKLLLLWIIFVAFERKIEFFIYFEMNKEWETFFSDDDKHCFKSIFSWFIQLFSHYDSVLMALNSNVLLFFFIFHEPIHSRFNIRIYASVLLIIVRLCERKKPSWLFPVWLYSLNFQFKDIFLHIFVNSFRFLHQRAKSLRKG